MSNPFGNVCEPNNKGVKDAIKVDHDYFTNNFASKCGQGGRFNQNLCE